MAKGVCTPSCNYLTPYGGMNEETISSLSQLLSLSFTLNPLGRGWNGSTPHPAMILNLASHHTHHFHNHQTSSQSSLLTNLNPKTYNIIILTQFSLHESYSIFFIINFSTNNIRKFLKIRALVKGGGEIESIGPDRFLCKSKYNLVTM